MKVMILIPTLGRLDRLGDVWRNVEETTPAPHTTVFVLEIDERPAFERLGWRRAGAENVLAVTNRRPGHHGAMNHALAELGHFSSWTHWFHGADDLRFHEGWLSEALEAEHELAGPGVVGTNDLLYAGPGCATHYLVNRRYLSRPAGVPPFGAYFEGYRHNYAETEFVDVAVEARRFVYRPTSIVEHLHPLAGKAELDSTYLLGQSPDEIEHDRELYASRYVGPF